MRLVLRNKASGSAAVFMAVLALFGSGNQNNNNNVVTVNALQNDFAYVYAYAYARERPLRRAEQEEEDEEEMDPNLPDLAVDPCQYGECPEDSKCQLNGYGGAQCHCRNGNIVAVGDRCDPYEQGKKIMTELDARKNAHAEAMAQAENEDDNGEEDKSAAAAAVVDELEDGELEEDKAAAAELDEPEVDVEEVEVDESEADEPEVEVDEVEVASLSPPFDNESENDGFEPRRWGYWEGDDNDEDEGEEVSMEWDGEGAAPAVKPGTPSEAAAAASEAAEAAAEAAEAAHSAAEKAEEAAEAALDAAETANSYVGPPVEAAEPYVTEPTPRGSFPYAVASEAAYAEAGQPPYEAQYPHNNAQAGVYATDVGNSVGYRVVPHAGIVRPNAVEGPAPTGASPHAHEEAEGAHIVITHTTEEAGAAPRHGADGKTTTTAAATTTSTTTSTTKKETTMTTTTTTRTTTTAHGNIRGTNHHVP